MERVGRGVRSEALHWRSVGVEHWTRELAECVRKGV